MAGEDMSWWGPQEASLSKAEVASREAYFTPPCIALQAVGAALERVGTLGEGLELVDPSAGAGVFCQVMRRLLGDGHRITAVDIAGRERLYLEHNADDVHIGDFLEYNPGAKVDLACTNPPFSPFYEFLEHGLDIARRVWLYAPIDVKFRGAKTAAKFRKMQKYVHGLVITPGPIGFTGDGKTDMRTYGLWMASNEDTGDYFDTTVLDFLDSHQRVWKGARPGTFDLPAEFGA